MRMHKTQAWLDSVCRGVMPPVPAASSSACCAHHRGRCQPEQGSHCWLQQRPERYASMAQNACALCDGGRLEGHANGSRRGILRTKHMAGLHSRGCRTRELVWPAG